MALRRAWQQSLSHLRQLAAAAERPVSAACAQPTAAPPGSSSRLYATLLPEDMAEAARRARFPARRPQPEAAASSSSSSTAEGATATVAATGAGAAPSAAAVAIAATPADTLAKGATQQEAARLVSGWMFPWERRQMEGGKLKVWEKLYWGVFVAGMALFLFNRLPREKEEPKVDETKEARKQELARLVLAGGSLLDEEEDVFAGLTPEEIQAYVEKTTGAKQADPFEGMSPEEINAYIAKNGMSEGA